MNPDQTAPLGPYCLRYRLPKDISRRQVMTSDWVANASIPTLFLSDSSVCNDFISELTTVEA